jgi:UDPglucose 6-dehydrogenase
MEKVPEINLTILQGVVAQIAVNYKNYNGNDYKVFVVRSTVPPGTTRRLGESIEDISGKILGKDFGMVMNPEYLRAYNSEDDFRSPRATTIGELDEKSGELVHKLYKKLTCPFFHTTLETAEGEKYLHNILNAEKISIFNRFYLICQNLKIYDRNGNSSHPSNNKVHKMDYEVIRKILLVTAEALWNPDYGTHAGVPYGGTCLPKDTKAMLTYLTRHNVEADMLKATINTNEDIRQHSSDVTGDKYFQKRQDSTYDNLPPALRNDHAKNAIEDVPDTIVIDK